jgi:hypothetical protein
MGIRMLRAPWTRVPGATSARPSKRVDHAPPQPPQNNPAARLGLPVGGAALPPAAAAGAGAAAAAGTWPDLSVRFFAFMSSVTLRRPPVTPP